MARLDFNRSNNLTHIRTAFLKLNDCLDTTHGHCVTNTDAEVDIDTINDAHISVLIPVMALFGCISTLGAVGNFLVCYVYGCKPKNTQSYLIVQLAAIPHFS